MANIARLALIPAAVAALSLTACGSPVPPPISYDPAATAAAVCVGEEVPDDLEDFVDRDLVVVPDDFCPIGDGEVPGHPYWWAYYPAAVGSEVDVPYVGSVIVLDDRDRHSRWSRVRPPRVSTLNIARGVYKSAPAPGQSSVRYSLAGGAKTRPVTAAAPPANSSIQRGGFGVPNQRASAAPSPVPNRAAAAPGRPAAPAPVRANTAPAAAKPAPARPAGPRPVVKSPSRSSVKSGRK